MPHLDELLPFVITGLALGAVYAVSGAGLVVLYRTTGVLNFAFGAIGMMGAFISWDLTQGSWCPDWAAYGAGVVFAIGATLLYGLVIAPQFAQRDALTKIVGTLGFALLILGVVFNHWNTADARRFSLPMKDWSFEIWGARANGVQVTAFTFGLVVTFGVSLFLRKTALGAAMRAIANDREIAALVGVPVRRVEAMAWLGSGIICGIVGLLLGSMVAFDAGTLTFLVIPSLAAALIGRLRSLEITFAAGIGIGVLESILTPFQWSVVHDQKDMTPFVLAIIAVLWFNRRRTVVLAGREMR